MIQDLLYHRLDNRYVPERLPQPDDAVISYADRKILIRDPDEEKLLVFPTVEEYTKASLSMNHTEQLIYLFALDQRVFFLAMGRVVLPGFSYRSLRGIREENLLPQEHVFAAFTAVHLGEWYRRKRYCGACGALLDHDGRERAMRCPSCQEVFYPRINPAVIVGVIDHDNLLITRYLRGYGHNALVAGFAEVGETLEETVAREVMEETGLRVKNIRYYKSQPWGIASDLLAGFFCDVDGDTQVKLDGQELKSAVWTPRGEVTWQPPDYSLTSDMMKAFHEGRV
jgi:NAD+ diphosphatase